MEDDALLRRLKDWSPSGHGLTVDLSGNYLAGHGVDALLRHVQKSGASVSKLKLHRNQLGDSAAKALANYLRNQSPDHPLLEIHLSDNQITDRGGLQILHAAHNCQCYPLTSDTVKKGGHGRRSLWLRLENNAIDDPGDMIYEASMRSGVRVHIERLIGWHNWDLKKALANAESAEVHMHFSVLQNKEKGDRKGKGKGKGDSEKGKGKSKDKGNQKAAWDSWSTWDSGGGESGAWDQWDSHPYDQWEKDQYTDYQQPSASSDYGGKGLLADTNQAEPKTIWSHAVDSVRLALERCADIDSPEGYDDGVSFVAKGKSAIEGGALSRARLTMGGLLGAEGADMLAEHCSSDVNLAFVFAELGIGNVEGAPTDIEGQAKAVREGAGQLAAKAEKQQAAHASLNALLDFACLIGFSEIRGQKNLPRFDDAPSGRPHDRMGYSNSVDGSMVYD